MSLRVVALILSPLWLVDAKSQFGGGMGMELSGSADSRGVMMPETSNLSANCASEYRAGDVRSKDSCSELLFAMLFEDWLRELMDGWWCCCFFEGTESLVDPVADESTAKVGTPDNVFVLLLNSCGISRSRIVPDPRLYGGVSLKSCVSLAVCAELTSGCCIVCCDPVIREAGIEKLRRGMV